MPRRKYQDVRVLRSVRIPKSLSDEVDKLLHDPFSDKVGHGKFSGLVTKLLTNYLTEVKRSKPDE